jgi:hypothetical protein
MAKITDLMDDFPIQSPCIGDFPLPSLIIKGQPSKVRPAPRGHRWPVSPWVPHCGSAPWRLQAVATWRRGPCHTWNHPQPSTIMGGLWNYEINHPKQGYTQFHQYWWGYFIVHPIPIGFQYSGSLQRPNPEPGSRVVFFDGQFCVWFWKTHEHPGRGRT